MKVRLTVYIQKEISDIIGKIAKTEDRTPTYIASRMLEKTVHGTTKRKEREKHAGRGAKTRRV